MFIWSDHGTTTSPSRAYPAMTAMGYVPFTERRRFCCMESLLLHNRQKETVAVYWLHPFSLWSLSWVCGHVVNHSSSLQKAKVDRFGNFYASCVDQFCIAAVHRTLSSCFCVASRLFFCFAKNALTRYVLCFGPHFVFGPSPSSWQVRNASAWRCASASTSAWSSALLFASANRGLRPRREHHVSWVLKYLKKQLKNKHVMWVLWVMWMCKEEINDDQRPACFWFSVCWT